jgi:hypothetical protein
VQLQMLSGATAPAEDLDAVCSYSMRPEEHHRWRCRGPSGKTYTTRFHCTEEQIRIEHPEAERVEGTLIVREVPETAEEQAAAMKATSSSAWRGD